MFLPLLTIWLNRMDNKKTSSAEQKILQAAHKVFTTRGLAGARMQDIADEAGINKAMLHYYFRDKDKLFEMVFTREAQKFFPKLKMIFEADIPFLKNWSGLWQSTLMKYSKTLICPGLY